MVADVSETLHGMDVIQAYKAEDRFRTKSRSLMANSSSVDYAESVGSRSGHKQLERGFSGELLPIMSRRAKEEPPESIGERSLSELVWGHFEFIEFACEEDPVIVGFPNEFYTELYKGVSERDERVIRCHSFLAFLPPWPVFEARNKEALRVRLPAWPRERAMWAGGWEAQARRNLDRGPWQGEGMLSVAG
ncbi:MAG: hypothetical protein ACKPKO_58545, partial [Candidatus Fonsibacter sp.]